MVKVKEITARRILDSRGHPTLETKVVLEDDSWGVASVPSGASKGKHEAWELRDGGKSYGGLDVEKAIKNVNKVIAPELVGQEFDHPRKIDDLMVALDGTKNKKRLGANSILSVSLAWAKSFARSQNLPLYQYLSQLVDFHSPSPESLPRAMFNIINGGKHGGGNIDFQEFMIVPHLSSASLNLQAASEIYYTLKEVLRKNKFSILVGDEGGFAPHLKSNRQALDLILEAVSLAGYRKRDIPLAMDVAASNLYQLNLYVLSLEGRSLPTNQLISLYNEWISNYPLISIEDGLSEDDFSGWGEMCSRIGDKVMLVGDDLFTTNPKRLEMGIKKHLANTVLVKPNQIGTLSETLEFIKIAKLNNLKVVVSHRSGETNDSFITDLAVGVGADYLKAGAPCRGERLAKYNRILEIEDEVKNIYNKCK